jgi:hypothetical protein
MKTFTARNLALGLTLGAAAIAGTAYAEQAMRGAGGVMTRAEVESHSAAMFARMDANKDGKLDRADREARRNMMFDRIDTDKNGQISRAEFSTPPQRQGMDGAKGPDGQGGKHHGWGGRGGRGHHGGGMMMGRMADADKDGAVSQAEFTAAALQRFDRADANKDGQVTKEERQSARKAMREEWRAKREAAAPAN